MMLDVILTTIPWAIAIALVVYLFFLRNEYSVVKDERDFLSERVVSLCQKLDEEEEKAVDLKKEIEDCWGDVKRLTRKLREQDDDDDDDDD